MASCKNDLSCTLDFEGLCTRRNIREPKELWRYTPPENFLVYGLRNAISYVFCRHFQEISMKENVVRGAGKSTLIVIVQFSIFGMING